MKDEYDLEAKVYDRIWGKYGYDSDVKFLNKLLKKHACHSIIDVGCGTGNHTIRLSKLGYKVTGVDISPVMLKIARSKDKQKRVGFKQGDMKQLSSIIITKAERFDAAISLGQVSSHLYTDKEVRSFLKGLRKILNKNGLFVFSARNAKQIKEEYLNKLRLDHVISEDKLQLAILTQNYRDPQNPNIIVWNPIYLMKEHGKVDLQIRQHKLRWFELSRMKKLLADSGFQIKAVHSGPSEEEFDEDAHAEMWFVATLK